MAVADVDIVVRKGSAMNGHAARQHDLGLYPCTGASPKGTWVRLFRPRAEGKLERGFQDLDVGDYVCVKLVHTDIERGFIDFVRV